MNPKKSFWKIIWWYPGGGLNSETGTADRIENLRVHIEKCGGEAHTYPPGAW